MQAARHLPPGWRRARLGDIVACRQERVTPDLDSTERYVAMEDLASGEPRIRGWAAAGTGVSMKTRFEEGDVLFGKLRPALRKAAPAPYDGVCSTELLALYGVDGMDSAYLAQVAQWKPLQDYAIATAIGTKMPRTTWEALAEFELPLPPPDEQRAIAAVLDSIDDAIEKTEAVIAATEQLRAALLAELLTRGIPGRHTEWKHVRGIGTVPACWEEARLRDCGTWRSGGTPSKADPSNWGGNIPWVSPKEMKRRVINETIDAITELGASSIAAPAPAGSVFIVVRGMILAHSFPVALAGRACAFNQDMRALECRAGVLPKFALALLECMKPRLLNLATPSTHGTMRIVSDQLFDLPIALPPENEQTTICTQIDALLCERAISESALAHLRRLKSGTAEALLSGKVRVRLAAKVPA